MRLHLAWPLLFTAVGSTAIKAKDYTDLYDSPPNFDPLLPLQNPVGDTVKGALTYYAWSYADLSLSAATLRTNTPPYNIGAGVTAKVTAGTRGFKPKAGFKYFTPRSIYYACQLYDAAGRPAVATKCTISLTGQKVTGSKGVITQTLEYDPAKLLVGNTFQKGTFDAAFKELVNVNVSVTPLVQDLLTVIDFDTFTYTAYS